MRALVYRGPHRLELEEVAAPPAAAGEVVVEVTAAGVCGTDRHIVAGELGVAPGTIPGHEIAGRVVECGPGVTDWPRGARVASSGQVVCGRCSACQAGCSNRCACATVLGMGRPGGFAERVALPDRRTRRATRVDRRRRRRDRDRRDRHPLPRAHRRRRAARRRRRDRGGRGRDRAARARDRTGARRGAPRRGRSVAVGPRGGARRRGERGARPARRAGPTPRARRARPRRDARARCVGRADSVELALGALAPGGRLVVVGVGGERPRLPPLARFVASELSVRGAFGSTLAEIRTVIEWIAAGRLETVHSVGRRVPLADGPRVFAEPASVARTVLTP